MSGISSVALEPLSKQRLPSWKAILALIVILGLVATNLLTLLHDGFHSKAYELVASVIMKLPGGQEILANSPTEVRKSDVEKATVKLTDEVGQVKKQLLAMTAANAALVLERTRLEGRVFRNKQTVQRISGRIGPRYVRNAARNVADLPAAAIPIAGIALNVALTVMDVKDACDTLHDLNEMNVDFELEPADASRVCGLHVPTVDEVSRDVKYNIGKLWDLIASWSSN